MAESLPFLLPLLLSLSFILLLPLALSASPEDQLNELISAVDAAAARPQLLDRNAFRMSFGKRSASGGDQQKQKWGRMDGNSFRMSFGKRSGERSGDGGQAEMLTHANIAIPLLFDLGGASGNALEPQMAETPLLAVPSEHQKHWPPRWRASLFRKRLDRNLFNVGFGRR